MTINNEPTMIEPTVLEAMMRALRQQDHWAAYCHMAGVLAEHGMYYDEIADAVRYTPQICPKEVASLEGPGEGNPERRTNTVKYRVTYNQADAEHALFEDAKRRADLADARLVGVQTFNESAAAIRAYVDLEVSEP